MQVAKRLLFYMQVATRPLFVTEQVLNFTKNQRHPRMAERSSALPSRFEGPKTPWSSISNHGEQKIAKEICSQLSAKDPLNLLSPQSQQSFSAAFAFTSLHQRLNLLSLFHLRLSTADRAAVDTSSASLLRRRGIAPRHRAAASSRVYLPTVL